MSKKTIKKSNLKMIVGLLILISGLVLGVKLVQKNQENRSKAASNETNSRTYCTTKEGVKTFSTDVSCGSEKYRYVNYTCYDNYTKKVGSMTACKTTSQWKGYAEQACKGHLGSFCITPTPTSKTYCTTKEGVKTFSTDVSCGSGKYRYVNYTCYDNYTKKVGSMTACKTTSQWKAYAKQACKGHLGSFCITR